MRAVIGRSPQAQGGIAARCDAGFRDRCGARWIRAGQRELLNPLSLPWFGLGRPRTARPARMDKPLRLPEPVVETGKDQRSPFRRCFKPRPPSSTGCAGFASGCRSSVSELWRPQRRVSRLAPADLAPGGCPASCPDAHRPTHGHRHVRNRATTHIIESRRESILLRAQGGSPAQIFVCER